MRPGTPAVLQAVFHADRKSLLGLPPRWKSQGDDLSHLTFEHTGALELSPQHVVQLGRKREHAALAILRLAGF